MRKKKRRQKTMLKILSGSFRANSFCRSLFSEGGSLVKAGLCLVLISFSAACKKDKTVIPTVRFMQLSAPVNGAINKMHFFDASTGFAVCDSGILLKTTNGGISWNTVSSFPIISGDLHDIQFPSATVGYIHAFDDYGNGLVYKTSDGGNTWAKLALGSGNEPDAVSCPTPLVIYCFNETYYPYKSTDGGYSWSALYSFTGHGYLSAFANKDTGYVCDYFDHEILKTTDGGSTWTTLSSIDFAMNIKFESSTTGYMIVGGNKPVYKTSDGGSNWWQQSIGSSETGGTLHGIDIASSGGIAVGEETIWVTKDGGETWEQRYNDKGVTIKGITLKDVYMINDQSAIACSSEGFFYKIEFGEK